MNNGKVRIYDLSKELNLDNKELLAICDQLNIAVKSHSSTIGETEAERIRSAAEKQVASAAPLRKEMSLTSPKSNLPNTGARPKPNPPHKQQILEIRKPKAPERANPNTSEPQALNPPQPPGGGASAVPRPYSSPTSPIKPTSPTKPVRSTPVEARQDTEDASDRPPKQEREMLVRQDVDQQAPLSGPPVRPVKEKAIQMPNLSQAERPVLKRDQVNQPRTKPPETTSGGDAPERPARRMPGVTRPEQVTPRSQPVVELNRPRPARANEPISAIAGRSRSSGGETRLQRRR
jgi:translation initiation factor IF-2